MAEIIKETGTLPPAGDTVKAKRHAPRGPLIQRVPIDDPDPIRAPNPIRPSCKATSRAGHQCKYPPIPGGVVCRFHGGAAPQVKLKAMERLLALQNPAIDRLTKLIDQDQFPTVAYAASRDILDRTMGKPAESQAVQLTGTMTFRHEMPE